MNAKHATFLHPVVNDARGRVMCGPAAIAMITGRTLQQAKEAVYAEKGKRHVCRMSMGLVLDVLLSLGWICSESVLGGRPTFAAWLREHDRGDDVWLVVLTNHFMVVQGDVAGDNVTMRPVPLAEAPNRRARVLGAYRVRQRRRP